MATVSKTPVHVPTHTIVPNRDEQLRSDRIKAVVVLAVMAALMTLVVWLATLNGAAPEVDHWYLMP